MVETADIIWANGPGPNPQQPNKAQIRAWGRWLEDSLSAAFTSGSSVIFLTKADLTASLGSNAGTLAWVTSDPVAANNGIYGKIGASGTGSWTRRLDLPYSFIRMTDAGAGTANAIQLTSSIPTSSSVLRTANVYEANTGNVTISENGATAKPLLTSSGNQIASGGLIAGMMIAYLDDGTNFRLLSDQASAAIQAAAEAAQARAETAQAAAEAARDAAQAAGANEFAATRSDLKALNTNAFTHAYLTEPGREGQFVWRTGDYSARIPADTREAVYIKADGIAATVGAWMRIYAPAVGPSITAFGIVFNDQSAAPDNTLALQAAMDCGWPGIFPEGTIYVSLVNSNYYLEGGATDCAVIAKSDVNWLGAGLLRSIIKMRDGESTDASPKYANLMASNAHLSNLHFEGIGFDLNGANNPISPDRGDGTYNTYNWAVLMMSGSIAVGTFPDDARLTNARFTKCGFFNTPGVTTIACAQTNANADGSGTGSILGENIEIDHCLFSNNGIDSNDYSAIYGWANNVRVHHNQFIHPTMSTGSPGPLCPMEMHGSDNYFEDNEVWGYYSGPYLCGNFTEQAVGQYIRRNKIITSRRGVLLFVEIATEPGLDEAHVEDNDITLTDDAHITDNPKRALNFVSSYGATGHIYSRRNTIRTTDTYGAYGLAVGVIASGKSMASVVSEDDTFIGFATPIAVSFTGAGTVGSVDIINPKLLDIAPNTTTINTIGIYGGNTGGRLRITGTRTTAVSGSHPVYLILLDAVTYTELMMDDNVGHSDSAIVDSSYCNLRSGKQATTFADATALGTRWPTSKAGDLAWCSDGSEKGSAGSKYTLTGWRYTGAGWLDRRELTGN